MVPLKLHVQIPSVNQMLALTFDNEQKFMLWKNLQLVENGSFSCIVKTNYDDFMFWKDIMIHSQY